MKKLATIVTVILISFAITGVFGCAKTAPAPSPAPAPAPAKPAPAPAPAKPAPAPAKPAPAPAKPTTAPAAPKVAPKPNWPKNLTLTTVSAGSSLGVYAVAVAQIIEKTLGIPTAPEHTAGSLESASLLVQGRAQFATPGAVLFGYAMRQAGSFANTKSASIMRGLTFGGYESWLHWVVRADSKIFDYPDLKGKRVMAQRIGEPGYEDYRPIVFAAYGLTDKDVILMPDLGPGGIASALKEGRADAGLFFSAPPTPAMVDLSTTVPIRILSFSDKAMKEIRERLPWSVYQATLPANTYKGQDKAASLVYINMGVAARKDLPDDLAYAIVKAIDENMGTLRAVHGQFKNWKIQDLANSPHGPYHAGAFKYYSEKGYLTPESIATHKQMLTKMGEQN